MGEENSGIYLGSNRIQFPSGSIEGGYVTLLNEPFYRIHNYDQMPPFFMSIVSSSDHWMFISSTGGLTAGRTSAESALFPYYTDDRLTENISNTGPLSILKVTRKEITYLWEPFSPHFDGLYALERNLYKNRLDDKLVFEEINSDLGLAYRYAWRFSESFGLVKTIWLQNTGPASCQIELLDGLQNLLPAGVSTHMQGTFSNLLNAYKRSELDPQTGLAVFSLSSSLSDLPEPSESLRATTVWQTGLEKSQVLLCTAQVEAFRRGLDVVQEADVRGQRGAYLVHAALTLRAHQKKQWSLVAEVRQDGASVAALKSALHDPAGLGSRLEADIALGSQALESIVASADGLQLSQDPLVSAHHFSNVLFNTMRGGIFPHNYTVEKQDLLDFIQGRNREIYSDQASFWSGLPAEFNIDTLLALAASTGSAEVERLCLEYLPLTFGRRHGDPSRPWNRFSINIKKPDGSPRLDYQGNWRDIFQNWEPLAWSFPGYCEQMISKFLNATTVDGYNPYRITRDGIEWEVPAPNDPWANIGYWGDHQIIYLQKLLEISEKFHPGRLQGLLEKPIFSHANVPFRIKPYKSLLEDWYNTILFDRDLHDKIAEAVKKIGMDGKLVRSSTGGTFHVNMTEKLLSLLLAKVGNFIPEGGIWMNTQRPEWNDGNNALVGKGISVVTLCHLRRFVAFFQRMLSESSAPAFSVTVELERLWAHMNKVLQKHQSALAGSFSDVERRQVMDELGKASSDYRWQFYKEGLSEQFTTVEKKPLLSFLELLQRYIDHSLAANVRPDHLYHAYNVLHLGERKASIGRLFEMLEGQVAILSSGLLNPAQALDLLHSLRQSPMYRPDQQSYMLYPDRQIPGFFQKNRIDPTKANDVRLFAELVARGDTSIIVKDLDGIYHFNGDFRNARDVKHALEALMPIESLAEIVEEEESTILDLFEEVFDHNSFTGRSGTFFAYEGLGSIYWHMVSKLLLAAQEAAVQAMKKGEPAASVQGLMDAYYEIRSGLGFNKSPEKYGAFPTDPYSHTPAGQGAKQPGMTGQVKEEILARWTELGLFVENGLISFQPFLLDQDEYLKSSQQFEYFDVHSRHQTLDVPAGSLAFTFCQVPFLYEKASTDRIDVHFADGSSQSIPGAALDPAISQHIFARDGVVKQVNIFLHG